MHLSDPRHDMGHQAWVIWSCWHMLFQCNEHKAVTLLTETRAAHWQFWAFFPLIRDFSGFWRSPFLVLFTIKWTSSWGFPILKLKLKLKNPPQKTSLQVLNVLLESSWRKKYLKLADSQKKLNFWRAINYYNNIIIIKKLTFASFCIVKGTIIRL